MFSLRYFLRLYWEIRIALHFWRAMRTSTHERIPDIVADAAAMALTRALRRKYPAQPFPYVVSLTESHARDVHG
jgi:hypothetical protein